MYIGAIYSAWHSVPRVRRRPKHSHHVQVKYGLKLQMHNALQHLLERLQEPDMRSSLLLLLRQDIKFCFCPSRRDPKHRAYFQILHFHIWVQQIRIDDALLMLYILLIWAPATNKTTIQYLSRSVRRLWGRLSSAANDDKLICRTVCFSDVDL